MELPPAQSTYMSARDRIRVLGEGRILIVKTYARLGKNGIHEQSLAEPGIAID
jgi:hypothetical protein